MSAYGDLNAVRASCMGRQLWWTARRRERCCNVRCSLRPP